MKRGRCYVGTSGWSYPHWAKGRFYPKGLKQGDWLKFYSGQFPTVEVNMTFYRLPKAEILSRWAHVTGPKFFFSVKLWRRITHEKRLAECDPELEQFFAATALFETKAGPLLAQFPPSFRRNDELIEKFLAKLRKMARGPSGRITVEFRNREWLCETVYKILDRYGVALCLADLPRCPITEPNQAGFVYVRRHGPQGGYSGRYSTQQVREDAARIRHWLDEGRDVYVYYNNDIEGYAVDNGRELIQAVGD